MFHLWDDAGQVMSAGCLGFLQTWHFELRPNSSILVSSDLRILFLTVWESLRCFSQTPSGLSGLFSPDCSVWQTALEGVLVVPRIIETTLLVGSLQCSKILFLCFFFFFSPLHILSQICARPQSCPWALQAVSSTRLVLLLWYTLSAVWPYLHRCAPSQIMSNQSNLPEVNSNQDPKDGQEKWDKPELNAQVSEQSVSTLSVHICWNKKQTKALCHLESRLVKWVVNNKVSEYFMNGCLTLDISSIYYVSFHIILPGGKPNLLLVWQSAAIQTACLPFTLFISPSHIMSSPLHLLWILPVDIAMHLNDWSFYSGIRCMTFLS